jgi:CheY-like chemotaxis protein
MAAKILVVDDDELVLIALTELLTPYGYEVTTASNGPEALATLDQNGVDLLVLDVIMPGMSGFELCERIRQVEKYRTIPVIMLTAKSSAEDRKRGMDAGADLFLPKPIAPQRLLDLVRSALL